MVEFSRRRVLQTATGVAAGAAVVRPTTAAAAVTQAAEHNPLQLWYRKPAVEWLQALAVGNGRMGAMVWGGVATETLNLNEDSVWGGGPHQYDDPQGAAALPEIRRLIGEDNWVGAQRLADQKFMGRPTEQMPYQPVGDLLLEFQGVDGELTSYRRSLDLTTAVTTTEFVVGGVRHKREVFASHPDQVIVMRISTSDRTPLSFDALYRTPQAATAQPHDRTTLALEGVSGDAEGIEGAVRFVSLVRAVTDGGSAVARGDRLLVRDAREVTLLISMASSYRNYADVGDDHIGKAERPLARVTHRGYDQLLGTHLRDYQALFGRVDIDLGTSDAINRPTDERLLTFRDGGDPQFAALYYQFGRYLLISSSRTPGQPANLQGIWSLKMAPEWQSKFTLNINAEMNYWPAGPANLAECWEPMFQMTEELSETGRRTAELMWDADGWVAHHNTDAWRGTAPVDFAYYGVWPMGGAWLCLLFWEQFEYTGDTGTLAKYYPVLRGSVEFFLSTLVRDERTGYLVTNPSHSPEVKHHEQDDEGVSICAGPTMDCQILRDLFTAFEKAADVLDKSDPMVAQAVAARAELPPNQIGYLGQLQEWLIDWEEAALERSRHVSHLWGVFPSDQITPLRTPELADAARKALELRGPAVTAGWSLAWKMNIRARLLEPDNAYLHVRQLLAPGRTAPNLFDLHPPFQIDGNFGGVSGITEMVLQSHSGEVFLLPCLPSAWPTGRVRGLRARGGHELEIRWEDGRLADARLRSLLGNRVRLRTDRPVDIVGVDAVERPEANVVEFDTRRNQTYRVRPR
ncbi:MULTISPECIES: glycosyl hydrolase family 95 catalytic domain-containing protein [unclassified Nocardioides]|uniref:glycoside hydrolase family 95 protein n=1 Tax=unclassified Nocardioides TaxID=2615069 RepID=UPI00360C66E7